MHASWSAPIPDDDPRIEAICRRFCAMGGLDPDEPVRTSADEGTSLIVRWKAHRRSAAQWVAAADAVDPLRRPSSP